MPINQIERVSTDDLHANDYNPNVVFNDELRLLKLSLMTNGRIQPILTDQNLEIIDWFHRRSLSKADKDLRELTGGLVPIVRMNLTIPERIVLTVRINRAKGSHIAIKMHELVVSLFNDHGMSKKWIGEQIGADKAEVDLLLIENVFKKKNIQDWKYSKARYPDKSK